MIKHIKLQPNDDRLLLNLIDATEKEHFLKLLQPMKKNAS